MIENSWNSHEEIANPLANTVSVRKAPKQAKSEKIRDHARTGHKIVVWRDNQVVWDEVSLSQRLREFEDDER
jgi:hypothetical protein